MTRLLALVANAADATISTFRLDTEAETIERVCVSEVPGPCGTFAVDAAADLVYAGYKGDPAGIATLRLDRGSGSLSIVATVPVESSLAYLDLTHRGRTLLGASYGGGFAATWPVIDGSVKQPTARVEHPNAHCIVASADGRFAYVVSLGADAVGQYALSKEGMLAPLSPALLEFPPGSGPRHLALDGNGSTAYLLTEFTAEAFRLTIEDDGTLSVRESVAVHVPDRDLGRGVFGGDPRRDHQIWGADLAQALDGQFLLCSERTESTLASVPVVADGTLGAPATFTPTVKQPRGFAVTPDSRHALVAGEADTTVGFYRIDDDGSLSLLGSPETGNGANWVRFVAC